MKKMKKSKKGLRKKRDLNRRLLNYSLAAGAALALATPATAAIRYSGVKNQVIDNSVFQLDMQDVLGGTPDGNPEFEFFNDNINDSFTQYSTWGGKQFVGAGAFIRGLGLIIPLNPGNAFMATATSQFSVANLPKGVFVGPGATNFVSDTFPPGFLEKYYKRSFQGVNTTAPSQTYAYSTKFDLGEFLGKSGYIGVRFNISGNTHYGWIQFKNAFAGSDTIVDWAYEDVPGKAIAAGDTGIEPVSVPTLNQWGIIFLAGLILLEGARRIRKEKVQETAPK